MSAGENPPGAMLTPYAQHSTSAGEVSDAAVEAGWAVAPSGVGPGIVRNIIESALPHLSPRPDAEVEIERLRDEAESNQSAHLHAAEGRAAAERRLAAVTALANRYRDDADSQYRGMAAHVSREHSREIRAALTTPAPAPVDDREALRAAIARAEVAERDRDALAQAIHDGRGILGFDNDGDSKPHTSDYVQYAEFWVADAETERADRDEVSAELEAAEAKVTLMRESLTNYPETCDKYPDPDESFCGWRSAVHSLRAALDGSDS